MFANVMSPRSTRRWAVAAAFAVALAWIGFITVLIYNEPPNGSSSVEALRSDVYSALSQRDAHSFSRLFADGSISDGYATAYLKKVAGYHPAAINVATVQVDQGTLLAVSGIADGGAHLCTEWNVKVEDGRYLLDGVPPAVSTGCR